MRTIIAILIAGMVVGCASDTSSTLGPFTSDPRIPDVTIGSVNLREVTLAEGASWVSKQTGVPIVFEPTPIGYASDYTNDQRFSLKAEKIHLGEIIAILCQIYPLESDAKEGQIILRVRPIDP
jgi:hypothetical protein